MENESNFQIVMGIMGIISAATLLIVMGILIFLTHTGINSALGKAYQDGENDGQTIQNKLITETFSDLYKSCPNDIVVKTEHSYSISNVKSNTGTTVWTDLLVTCANDEATSSIKININ